MVTPPPIFSYIQYKKSSFRKMSLSIEKNAPKCTTYEPSHIKGLRKSEKKFSMAGLSRILVQKNENAPFMFLLKFARNLVISRLTTISSLHNNTRLCPTFSSSGAFFVHGFGNAPLKNFDKMHQNCKNPNLMGFPSTRLCPNWCISCQILHSFVPSL